MEEQAPGRKKLVQKFVIQLIDLVHKKEQVELELEWLKAQFGEVEAEHFKTDQMKILLKN